MIAPESVPIALRDAWVVFSHEHKGWWSPDERGYTDSLLAAGVYSRERANAIVDEAEKGNESSVSLADAIALEMLRNGLHVPPGSVADAILRELPSGIYSTVRDRFGAR